MRTKDSTERSLSPEPDDFCRPRVLLLLLLRPPPTRPARPTARNGALCCSPEPSKHFRRQTMLEHVRHVPVELTPKPTRGAACSTAQLCRSTRGTLWIPVSSRVSSVRSSRNCTSCVPVPPLPLEEKTGFFVPRPISSSTSARTAKLLSKLLCSCFAVERAARSRTPRLAVSTLPSSPSRTGTQAFCPGQTSHWTHHKKCCKACA